MSLCLISGVAFVVEGGLKESSKLFGDVILFVIIVKIFVIVE